MNKIILTLVISFFCLLNSHLFAQQDFAQIEKNTNIRARGLHHDLNVTKDTLILKGDTKINSIFSIHNNMKRDINSDVYATDYKVALRDINKGKHTFVVEQQSLKIVFVVRVFGDAPSIIASNN